MTAISFGLQTDSIKYDSTFNITLVIGQPCVTDVLMMLIDAFFFHCRILYQCLNEYNL